MAIAGEDVALLGDLASARYGLACVEEAYRRASATVGG